ncbi:uncharacterized protein ACRADG_001255 isoform 1-T5 [Cochliomyia hominivorax]
MENTQHDTEQESDEDCEVYFLKPVNEYNIMDKIKEANKELFAQEDVNESEIIAEAQQNRKVSFAANLEEYEPQNGINLKELEDKLGKNAEEHLLELDVEQKLEVITEEETVNEVEISENAEINCQVDKEEAERKIAIDSLEDLISQESQETATECENQEESSINDKESVEENILEEICEEILVMDMESDKVEEPVETKIDSSSLMQRKMLKQITFDYTEEDDEPDNKSLTNLLISDNDNDPSDEEPNNQEYNCNESIQEDSDNEDKLPLTNTNTEYYEDVEEEEDDKLSIIVASYLPDDMACDKTLLTSSAMKCSPRTTKSRKLPFNKRFSFRRKTKSSNAIGSFTNHHSTANNRRFMPPPEVTDLKLHYKTCCEFKNTQQKLPKYTGYLSEYGLSREQLIERERKLQQKQQGKEFNTLKTSEAEMRKMHDNERAFTTWLKNKMRFPINKTRNMFDVKRPFGLRKCTSVGGNSLNDDTNQILNTTKYRSISAKFKKS